MEKAQMPPSHHPSTPSVSFIPIESCCIYKGRLHCPQLCHMAPNSTLCFIQPEQPDLERQAFLSLPDRCKPGVHLSWQTGCSEQVRKAEQGQGTDVKTPEPHSHPFHPPTQQLCLYESSRSQNSTGISFQHKDSFRHSKGSFS